jgi:competence protein ComEA
MFALTEAERRGAWVVVALLLIGTAHDLWRAHTLARQRESIAARTSATDSAAAPYAGPGDDSLGPRPPRALTPRPPGESAAPIDLNHATAQELDALPGVGPVLAGRIVTQRTLHGPYRRVEDLLAVRGIGPRLLDRIRPHVIVRGEAPG